MTIRQDIRTVLKAKRGRPQRLTGRQRVSILNETTAAVKRYAKRNPALAEMVRDSGRLGRFLTTVAGIFGKRTIGRKEIEAAVRILLAAGFGITPAPTRRGEKPGASPFRPTPPSPSRQRGGEIVTAEFAEDPVLAEIVGDGVPVDPQAASRAKQEAARVHLVDSSNVHSYYYVRDKERGTLYVTFLKWTPGSKTRSGPGATYAYYRVPVGIYADFRALSRSSAGRAVWKFLRVEGEGNRARHQYPYGLTRVAPLGIRDTEAYVPRKITRTGFRTRNLPDLSGRSTLRPRTFEEAGNRAKPVTEGGRRRFV